MLTTLDNSYLKLKQMLADRYGKTLQIRQLMDLAKLGSSEEGTLLRGRDLHIPISVNGAILGTAVVIRADDLTAEKRQGVAQLVRMVLEPAMYKWYLDQKEANLREISKVGVTLDNVVLFGDDPLPSIDEILTENSELLNESPTNDLVSHIIHLEGRSETTNKKAALQLHEISGRWAFVPFHDIKGQLHSSQDISKMGAVTILVENVETLNAAEQELLTEYIQYDHESDEPLIVTSSLVSLKSLEKCLSNSRLTNELSTNCFEVDKAPLTAQGLKEVLELFFIKDSPIDA